MAQKNYSNGNNRRFIANGSNMKSLLDRPKPVTTLYFNFINLILQAF